MNLVKAKTPKITLYSAKAKSYLMENEPDPDFEAYFYSGVKITLSGGSLKAIDLEGRSRTFSHPISAGDAPPDLSLAVEHFNNIYDHCRRLENTLSQNIGRNF